MSFFHESYGRCSAVSSSTAEGGYNISIPPMDNPRYSGNDIDDTVAHSAGADQPPPYQPRTENAQHGITGSPSHADHVPGRQELPGPSAVGLNYPAGETFGNYGIAPPPYSPIDLGNEANKPGSQEGSQEIPQQITIVTLEEPPSPCCNHCSWSCWRTTQLTLAVLIFIVAAVKICLLIFSN